MKISMLDFDHPKKELCDIASTYKFFFYSSFSY